jgi:hypothetical protein
MRRIFGLKKLGQTSLSIENKSKSKKGISTGNLSTAQ